MDWWAWVIQNVLRVGKVEGMEEIQNSWPSAKKMAPAATVSELILIVLWGVGSVNLSLLFQSSTE